MYIVYTLEMNRNTKISNLDLKLVVCSFYDLSTDSGNLTDDQFEFVL